MLSSHAGEISRHRERFTGLTESFPDFGKWFSNLPEWFCDA
jgi:hypothetical protein